MRWLKKTCWNEKEVSIRYIKEENDTDDLKTAVEAEKRSNNVKASEWITDFRISHSSKACDWIHDNQNCRM